MFTDKQQLFAQITEFFSVLPLENCFLAVLQGYRHAFYFDPVFHTQLIFAMLY